MLSIKGKQARKNFANPELKINRQNYGTSRNRHS
jgi:hypothetical protein